MKFFRNGHLTHRLIKEDDWGNCWSACGREFEPPNTVLGHAPKVGRCGACERTKHD